MHSLSQEEIDLLREFVFSIGHGVPVLLVTSDDVHRSISAKSERTENAALQLEILNKFFGWWTRQSGISFNPVWGPIQYYQGES